MGIKQLYNDNLRKLPNEYGDVSVMAHAQPSSGARCLIFGRTLRLLPYFMFANGEGSGETALMRRLT